MSLSLRSFSRVTACATNTNHKVVTQTKSNRHLDEAIIIKDVIKQYISGEYRYGKLEELEADIAASYVDVDDVDVTQVSYEHALAKQLNRYLRHEYRRSNAIIPEEPFILDLSEFVETHFEDDDDIHVRIDVIFKSPGILEAVIYKKGTPKLGSTASAKRNVNNEITLYLILRALRQYADTILKDGESVNLIASYYYMKKTTDTSISNMTDDYFGTNAPIRSLSEKYTKLANGIKAPMTQLDVQFKELLDKWATGYEKHEMDEQKDCENCSKYAVCFYRPAPIHSEEVEVKARKKMTPTEEQLQIINAKEGVIIVNAGAGSGKTETAIKQRTVDIVLSELNELIEKYESGEDINIPITAEFVTKDSRR